MRCLVFILLLTVMACTPKATAPVQSGSGTSDTPALKDDQPDVMEGDDALGSRQLTGMFRIVDGKYEFTPCDAPSKTYWLLGDLTALAQQYEDATLQGYPGQHVVATFSGMLIEPRGGKGATQTSPYDAQFRVVSIDRVRAKNPRNVCLPSDFWGVGNEPFWSLQISEAEGVIELSQVGTPTVAFDYVMPVISQEGKLTQYVAEGTQQRLKIDVYQEDCLDDMAGNRFTHRMEVRYKGQVLKGCAK